MPPRDARKDAKTQRLAALLKSNLKKRKAQAKARALKRPAQAGVKDAGD